jgi:lipopolysaccharide exporter
LTSLTRSALGGVAWNSAGSVILVVAQIASTAATARLVAPREFGLYATAQAATGVFGYFTMSALGSGLQRRSRLGEKTVGTALSLSLVSSFVVGGALFFAASLWARAWGVPDATATVRVVALTLILASAAIVPLALIRRRLEFSRAATIETGSQVLAMGGGVALAIAAHSALALAAGQAVGAATLLVIAGAMVRDDLRLSFDRADARELFTFASQVGALGFVAYLVITVPAWFTARAFGASMLGVYSRASLIVDLPATYVTTSIFKVLYPLYGRVRDDLTRVKTLLNEGLTLTTGLVWPFFGLVAGAAPVIVSVVLGSRWDAASPLLPLFALAACAYIPCGLLTNAAEARGWMRIIAARECVFFAGVVATLFTVHVADLGLSWLLAGVAASQWATYLLTLSPFVRRDLIDGSTTLRVQGIHAAVGVAAYGAAAACVRATDGTSLAVQVLALVGISAAVYGALVACRGWFPAGRILGRRLVQVMPAGRSLGVRWGA